MNRLMAVSVLFCCATLSGAERINHEGRILGSAPTVTAPILFNTPEADAVVSAMQILPATNPWNERVDNRPVLPNSDDMIARIIADLDSRRRTLRAFQEMNFVLVPDNQSNIPIEFQNYPDESDLNGGDWPYGAYPIPVNLPVETWPSGTGGVSLEDWQAADDGSDRHSIIVQPGTGDFWETWRTVRVGTSWNAANGAQFNLHTNALRPPGWTSADAAGLPMFPALVRYDECERAMVEHACRIVVRRTRREFIYPATHYASTTPATETNVPAMGQRVRLKASFVIPSDWSRQEQAILKGLKKYGALVADNGGFFSISVTPDDRWPEGCFDHLSTISITNFEVIQTTGPNEGPRSPGAPRADAGMDRTVETGQPSTLDGVVDYDTGPPTIGWTVVSGPVPVWFSDPTQANPLVNFSTSGIYTLMLSADDGVHTVAYDAVVLTVIDTIVVTASTAEGFVGLTWVGGNSPFVVETTDVLPATIWRGVATTSVRSASVPVDATSSFYRVRSH